MGLSIKNAEVERMVRELTAARGADDRGAAAAARRRGERAAAARDADVAEKLRKLHEIQARIAALPDVSDMTDDEIFGYDEDGIPSRGGRFPLRSSQCCGPSRVADDFVSARSGRGRSACRRRCLLETCMVMAGERDRTAGRGRRLFETFGLRVLPFAEDHAREAVVAFLRYGKGRHPAGLNFGDCMAYAVAQAEGAPLLFTDSDFARTNVEVAGSGGGTTHPNLAGPHGGELARSSVGDLGFA